MGADQDPPTGRLVPEEPVVREYVAAEPAEHELLRRLKSLQAALALVGVLAAAALGVALYALLTDEDRTEGDGRRGASPTRVEQLEDRVDELEQDVEERATKSSVSQLRGEQEQLGEQLEQVAGDNDGEAATQAVEELGADVQALQERVDELAQQQAQGDAGGSGTDTP